MVQNVVHVHVCLRQIQGIQKMIVHPTGSIIWVWDIGGVGYTIHTNPSLRLWLVGLYDILVCYPLLPLPRPPASQIILPMVHP